MADLSNGSSNSPRNPGLARPFSGRQSTRKSGEGTSLVRPAVPPFVRTLRPAQSTRSLPTPITNVAISWSEGSAELLAHPSADPTEATGDDSSRLAVGHEVPDYETEGEQALAPNAIAHAPLEDASHAERDAIAQFDGQDAELEAEAIDPWAVADADYSDQHVAEIEHAHAVEAREPVAVVDFWSSMGSGDSASFSTGGAAEAEESMNAVSSDLDATDLDASDLDATDLDASDIDASDVMATEIALEAFTTVDVSAQDLTNSELGAADIVAVEVARAESCGDAPVMDEQQAHRTDEDEIFDVCALDLPPVASEIGQVPVTEASADAQVDGDPIEQATTFDLRVASSSDALDEWPADVPPLELATDDDAPHRDALDEDVPAMETRGEVSRNASAELAGMLEAVAARVRAGEIPVGASSTRTEAAALATVLAALLGHHD